jgi:hypothetical protein
MSTGLLCPELEVESQDSEEEEDGLMNLSLRNNEYQNSQMCIVTGHNQDVAIKPIKRMKGLFEHKLAITFANKETVLFYFDIFLSQFLRQIFFLFYIDLLSFWFYFLFFIKGYFKYSIFISRPCLFQYLFLLANQ